MRRTLTASSESERRGHADARGARATDDVAVHGDAFAERHIGPDERDVSEMLATLRYDSLDALIDDAVPKSIRLGRDLALPRALSERDALTEIGRLARENEVFKSYLGMGYSDCVTPPVLVRNILENPGWY